TCDFGPHKLRSDKLRDRCTKRLAFVLMEQRVTWRIASLQGGFASEVLANRDELHLRRDDAATRVVKLRHTRTRLCAQHRATQRGKVFKPADVFHARTLHSVEREITIVNRLRLTTRILFNVTATNDPLAPQLRQTFANFALKLGIAPRPARVVNTDRRIRVCCAIEIARLALRDFAKRNAHARLFAVNVNASRIWQ